MKKYGALGLLLLVGGLSGCAGLSQVNPQYVDLAQEQLHKMGGFYDYLVDQKAVPDNKQAVTQVLMGLDLAADIFQSVMAGSQVDADKLQEAAVLTATGDQVAAQLQNK